MGNRLEGSREPRPLFELMRILTRYILKEDFLPLPAGAAGLHLCYLHPPVGQPSGTGGAAQRSPARHGDAVPSARAQHPDDDHPPGRDGGDAHWAEPHGCGRRGHRGARFRDGTWLLCAARHAPGGDRLGGDPLDGPVPRPPSPAQDEPHGNRAESQPGTLRDSAARVHRAIPQSAALPGGCDRLPVKLARRLHRRHDTAQLRQGYVSGKRSACQRSRPQPLCAAP